MRRRDGDTARFLFGRVVDRIKRPELDLRVVLLQYLGDGRRQRGLAVVNVTDRAHVHVRLMAFKFLFRHFLAPSVLLVWSGHCCPRCTYLVVALPCIRAMISSDTERGASS